MMAKKTSRAPKTAPRDLPKDFVNPHAETNQRELHRINRIIGQLEGVARMIEGKRHCYEVIHQVRSTAAAVQALEAAILENHLEHLFKEITESKDPKKRAEMKDALLHLFKGRLVF